MEFTTNREAQMFHGLALQTRQILNCQGAIRTYYRYGNSGRWYRSIVSAQIGVQSR